MKTKTILVAALACTVALATHGAQAEDINTDTGIIDSTKVFPVKPPYSPYANRSFPTRPFFGDTHLHTSLSFDAGAAGCRVGPKDAYRFAKGEQIMASSGQPVKLSRPLD